MSEILAPVDCEDVPSEAIDKVVTDGQTDSLTNLIKFVVVYCSYSYAFWPKSLWAPDYTCVVILTI